MPPQSKHHSWREESRSDWGSNHASSEEFGNNAGLYERLRVGNLARIADALEEIRTLLRCSNLLALVTRAAEIAGIDLDRKRGERAKRNRRNRKRRKGRSAK